MRYWYCPWDDLGPCGPDDLRVGNPLHAECGWRDDGEAEEEE